MTSYRSDHNSMKSLGWRPPVTAKGQPRIRLPNIHQRLSHEWYSANPPRRMNTQTQHYLSPQSSSMSRRFHMSTTHILEIYVQRYNPIWESNKVSSLVRITHFSTRNAHPGQRSVTEQHIANVNKVQPGMTPHEVFSSSTADTGLGSTPNEMCQTTHNPFQANEVETEEKWHWSNMGLCVYIYICTHMGQATPVQDNDVSLKSTSQMS
jgi:hypothetical protein